MRNLLPLRNIPISITVDGVEVHGEILSLHPNDISVVITSPVSGLGNAVHIPHRHGAPCRVDGWQTKAVTAYGRATAEWLLARLYEYSRGLHSGWPVDAVSAEGWGRLPCD
jgi:hypothetical protein